MLGVSSSQGTSGGLEIWLRVSVTTRGKLVGSLSL